MGYCYGLFQFTDTCICMINNMRYGVLLWFISVYGYMYD